MVDVFLVIQVRLVPRQDDGSTVLLNVDRKFSSDARSPRALSVHSDIEPLIQFYIDRWSPLDRFSGSKHVLGGTNESTTSFPAGASRTN